MGVEIAPTTTSALNHLHLSSRLIRLRFLLCVFYYIAFGALSDSTMSIMHVKIEEKSVGFEDATSCIHRTSNHLRLFILAAIQVKMLLSITGLI